MMIKTQVKLLKNELLRYILTFVTLIIDFANVFKIF